MGVGKRAALAIAVVALVACDDSKGTVKIDDVEGGTDYPTPMNTDGGFNADAGASKVGPLVMVMSPPASTDPVAGPVLSGPSVDVKCNVVQRDKTGPVDPTKVAIWVYAAGMIDPVLKVPAVLQATDTFGASVALDTVPTGGVRFRCLAADTAAISQTGFGDVFTFYDAGPKITFTNLNAESIIKFGTDTANDLSVQFKVEPSRLSDLDAEADITDVKLSVSGREKTFPPSADGSYEQSYDFNDLFAGIAVDSVTIVVSATNKRSKAPVTAKKQLLIRIDSEGPSVTFTAPPRPNGAAPIVGGTVTIVMTITDTLSGVAEGSDKVYAKIDQRIYPLTKGTNGVYSFTFEAADFKNTANITAQIYAFDKAGNTRKEVPNFSMHLDTVPPWVSLDPAPVRVCNKMTGQCSRAFDPIGLTPRDGQVVAKEALFRALVWERGIRVEGQNTIWIAGVRDETVTFYAQPDPAVPLLVDTNGDMECDTINNASTLGDRAPFVQSFTQIAPSTGAALPSTTAEELMTEDPRVSGATPLTGTMPMVRCDLSEMTYVINHTAAMSMAVVYAMNTADVCTGQSIDPGMKGGWTCIAASARDRAGTQGNLGISRPLRVCRAVSPTDCVGENATPPASLTCTDGCTIPVDWTKEPTDRVYAY